MTRKRAETLLTKEPETLAWIDGFPEGSRFADVGANIGCYTLYAGWRYHEVFAFEPEPRNFTRLCQNVRLNHLSRVHLYPVALSDHHGVGALAIRGDEAGKSKHKLWKRGSGILVERLDAAMRSPDYIKIDTDGHERRIVRGAMAALAGCRSAMIEINEGQLDIVDTMRELGFEGRQAGGMVGVHSDYCGNWLFARGSP